MAQKPALIGQGTTDVLLSSFTGKACVLVVTTLLETTHKITVSNSNTRQSYSSARFQEPIVYKRSVRPLFQLEVPSSCFVNSNLSCSQWNWAWVTLRNADVVRCCMWVRSESSLKTVCRVVCLHSERHWFTPVWIDLDASTQKDQVRNSQRVHRYGFYIEKTQKKKNIWP